MTAASQFARDIVGFLSVKVIESELWQDATMVGGRWTRVRGGNLPDGDPPLGDCVQEGLSSFNPEPAATAMSTMTSKAYKPLPSPLAPG
jgi:hypothetical protein